MTPSWGLEGGAVIVIPPGFIPINGGHLIPGKLATLETTPAIFVFQIQVRFLKDCNRNLIWFAAVANGKARPSTLAFMTRPSCCFLRFPKIQNSGCVPDLWQCSEWSLEMTLTIVIVARHSLSPSLTWSLFSASPNLGGGVSGELQQH